MDDRESRLIAARAKSFLSELNKHGHGFAAKVLAECHGHQQVVEHWSKSEWLARSREYPVALAGRDFHIDGLLQLRVASATPAMRYAVLECKRVDPALKDWCFIRAESATQSEELNFDIYTIAKTSPPVVAVSAGATYPGHTNRIPHQVAHLGMELKGGEHGNSLGKTLDDAVTQVVRGASGLAEQLQSTGTPGERVTIMPIIVTTASLFVANRVLEDAELQTGNLPDLELTPVDWLWYVQHVSASLLPAARPQIDVSGEYDAFGQWLRHRHRRTILVSSVKGLPAVLTVAAQSHIEPLRR